MAPALKQSRRSSASPTGAEADALFEFDAPQLFVDLRAACGSADARDPWFDELHEQHSRPSAELARELALVRNKEPRARKDDADKQPERAQETRQLSPGSEKENRGERKPRAPARRKFLSLKEARATQKPFQVGRSKALVKTVAAPTSTRKRSSPGSDSDGGRPSDPAATPKKRQPLGTLNNAKAKATGRSAAATTSRKPVDARPTAQQQLKPQLKRRRPGSASTPADSDMAALKALLARHNKKFKTQHTYEPPKHSVRDIKSWERETKQSFYALNVEERHRANEEITLWLKERREAKLERQR